MNPSMGPISGYLTPVAMLLPTAKMCHSKVELKTLVRELRLLLSDNLGMGVPQPKKGGGVFPHCFRETKTTH